MQLTPIKEIYGSVTELVYIDQELLLRIQGKTNDTQFTKLYYN